MKSFSTGFTHVYRLVYVYKTSAIILKFTQYSRSYHFENKTESFKHLCSQILGKKNFENLKRKKAGHLNETQKDANHRLFVTRTCDLFTNGPLPFFALRCSFFIGKISSILQKAKTTSPFLLKNFFLAKEEIESSSFL